MRTPSGRAASRGPGWPFWLRRTSPTLLEKKLADSSVSEVTKVLNASGLGAEADRSALVTEALDRSLLGQLALVVREAAASEEPWSWWQTGSVHRASLPTAQPLRDAARGGDPELTNSPSAGGCGRGPLGCPESQDGGQSFSPHRGRKGDGHRHGGTHPGAPSGRARCPGGRPYRGVDPLGGRAGGQCATPGRSSRRFG